jgi:hypothetical protein
LKRGGDATYFVNHGLQLQHIHNNSPTHHTGTFGIAIMPRILNRFDALPRSTSSWHHHQSGSSPWNSPTISKYPSAESSKRLEGMSYLVRDEVASRSHQDTRVPHQEIPDESSSVRQESENGWGHFVDFYSPVQELVRRKSMVLDR